MTCRWTVQREDTWKAMSGCLDTIKDMKSLAIINPIQFSVVAFCIISTLILCIDPSQQWP